MTTHANTQPSTVIDDSGLPAGGSPADAGTQMVSGIVQPDGTLYNGSGFSVSQNGTGSYAITFDPPFSAVPAFSLTPGGTTSSLYTNPLWVSNSGLTFTYQNAQGEATDSWFFLIAVGAA
jgi:hypothetical protein